MELASADNYSGMPSSVQRPACRIRPAGGTTPALTANPDAPSLNLARNPNAWIVTQMIGCDPVFFNKNAQWLYLVQHADHAFAQEVERGFPQVLHFAGTPDIPGRSSGRRELAEWITSPNNPLRSSSVES